MKLPEVQFILSLNLPELPSLPPQMKNKLRKDNLFSRNWTNFAWTIELLEIELPPPLTKWKANFTWRT